MLKFITEQCLRELYKANPFETYCLKDSERLTPGGRQFLIDRRIKIEDKFTKKKIGLNKSFNTKEIKSIPNKFFYKLKSLELQMLLIVSETMKKDTLLAQKLLNISRMFRNVEKKNEDENLHISSQDIDKLVIHDIVIHNPRSVEIFKLTSILYELEFITRGFLEDKSYENNCVIDNLNYIKSLMMDIVSELLGGIQCQKE